jgi:DNA-binding transcriptional LysR family regulator
LHRNARGMVLTEADRLLKRHAEEIIESLCRALGRVSSEDAA